MLYITEMLNPVLKTVLAIVPREIRYAEHNVDISKIRLTLVYHNGHMLVEHDTQLYEKLEEIASNN